MEWEKENPNKNGNYEKNAGIWAMSVRNWDGKHGKNFNGNLRHVEQKVMEFQIV